jgi:TPR repeat protein
MKTTLQLLLLLTTFFMLSGVNAAFTFDDYADRDLGVNTTSIKQLKSLSESGSIEAQVKLATLYFKGKGVPQNYEKAIDLLTKAAKDSPKAQGYLAHIYAGGYGVEQNDAIAIEWAKKGRLSSNNAFRNALSIPEAYIATRFEDSDGYGLGTTTDWIEATKWRIKAAKLGHGSSQLWLGEAYEKGYSHVAQSYDKAMYWYKKAANATYKVIDYDGDLAAIYLGVLYLEGLGVRADKEKGMHLIFEKNNKDFDFKGRCIVALNRTGYSLVRYGEAYTNLIKQCSELGSSKAQYKLSWAYQQGKGVPENYILAYKWMTLAASKAEPDDLKLFHNDLKLLRNSFTQYQIQKGQDLAGDWFPKKYKAIKSKKSKTNKSKTVSSGTGFRVDKNGLYLTNHHVVRGCNTIKINGKEATVKSVDKLNDLALLQSYKSKSIAYFRAGRGIRLGDGVTVAGYPLRSVLGSGLNVVTGTVASLSGVKNNSSRLQITAPINSGNSGGPLFDSSGRVVGVIVSKINKTKAREVLGEEIQGANFAIKGSVVRSFLDMNDVDYEVSTSNKNMSTADIAENAKEYTALIKCWK